MLFARRQFPQLIIKLALLLCVVTKSANGCVDDNARIAELAAMNGNEDVSACVDILGGCALQNAMGDALREICCVTCNDIQDDTPPENELPPADETVRVFLLSGQSECSGAADPNDLNADPNYDELKGDIDGVWFAGYKGGRGSESSFFVAPMSADVARSTFGPEVSFGERYYSITGKRTLILKYCAGGTNVHTHWNPDTDENSWDKEADDGTAQWMSDNAGLDFKNKPYLFKNMSS